MAIQFQFDRATAIRIAELLEAAAMPKAAADIWLGLCAGDPYDRWAREKFGDIFFEQKQFEYPPGTVGRSQFILQVIGLSFPTPLLRDAYFDNLRSLLHARARRSQPGEVILGLGSGRCGSTTLTAAFEGLPDACATHENPPLVDWQPTEEQLQFHFDRFRLLAGYYAVVHDASHSWLHSLERFFAEFPTGKAIGLHRDTAACVRSYLRIKGTGRGSINHWVPPNNGIWGTGPADPSYPSYAVSTDPSSNLDAAKAELIERYVQEYNQTLHSKAASHPDRLLLVSTETMNTAETAARLKDFLGWPLAMPAALNIGGTQDSARLKQKF
jgi:hypothetical protein